MLYLAFVFTWTFLLSVYMWSLSLMVKIPCFKGNNQLNSCTDRHSFWFDWIICSVLGWSFTTINLWKPTEMMTDLNIVRFYTPPLSICSQNTRLVVNFLENSSEWGILRVFFLISMSMWNHLWRLIYILGLMIVSLGGRETTDAALTLFSNISDASLCEIIFMISDCSGVTVYELTAKTHSCD